MSPVCINACRLKWRGAFEVFCGRKVLLKLKGNFYIVVFRNAMMYSLKFWSRKKHGRNMKIRNEDVDVDMW